jgi:hypothetical protein
MIVAQSLMVHLIEANVGISDKLAMVIQLRFKQTSRFNLFVFCDQLDVLLLIDGERRFCN